VAEIQVEEGDTSTAPYGLGTYGSRSTNISPRFDLVLAHKKFQQSSAIVADA